MGPTLGQLALVGMPTLQKDYGSLQICEQGKSIRWPRTLVPRDQVFRESASLNISDTPFALSVGVDGNRATSPGMTFGFGPDGQREGSVQLGLGPTC